ncbi:hypothetical protein F8M41_024748 [Gigaspora margarita]|uniref:Uncharacterized protein n=1 Tax=Gigaspora margarita TaxID=4874 RepID=A0A8H4ABD1_GIGMA|nr:hypothetical protein F8M41_024748 [Gigaspora margarita]
MVCKVPGLSDRESTFIFQKTFIYLQAIINYWKAIRTNPLLKQAARREFSSIWSARHHSIYCLIEVSEEVQSIRLCPEI